MEIPSGTIGIIATIIITPIIMGLLGKIKSLQPEKTTEKDLDQLEEEYSKWNNLSLVPFFIFAFSIGFLIWYGLNNLSTYRMSLLEESVYLFPPARAAWGLPAVFMSLILSAIPLHYLYLWILGKERYSEFNQYTNLKFGIDGTKTVKYMSVVIVPACLIFTLLAMDSYIKVTKDSFIANPLLTLGVKEFRFEEIESIELTKSFKAPNGNIVRRSYYTIEFNNGYTYDLESTMSELDFKQQQEIVDYITKNSDVTIKINDPYPQ